jgi:hypothetical protein
MASLLACSPAGRFAVTFEMMRHSDCGPSMSATPCQNSALNDRLSSSSSSLFFEWESIPLTPCDQRDPSGTLLSQTCHSTAPEDPPTLHILPTTVGGL